MINLDLPIQYDRNPELDIQLQAPNDDDYEKDYLALENFLSARSKRESISKPQSDQNNTLSSKRNNFGRLDPIMSYNHGETLNSRPINAGDQLIQNAQGLNTVPNLDIKSNHKMSFGQNLMIYFYLKRFFANISRSSLMFQNLKSQHIQLIGDQSADEQVLLKYISGKEGKAFKMSQYKKLMQLQSSKENSSNTQSYFDMRTLRFKACIQTIRYRLYSYIDGIPIIQPESGQKIVWDYCATLVRVFLLICIPLEIAFQPKILFWPDQSYATVMAVLLLAFDALLRLNTVCYVEGQAITERDTILKYQLKSSFIVDSISILPLVYFLINEASVGPLAFFMLSFFLQIGHILRVIRQTEESAHLSKQNQGVLGLVWFLFTLLYILHIFSCIWFVNSIGDARSHLKTWISEKDILDAEWSLQYLEAFYYATVTLMTIGYGDITPQNPKEKILSVVFILIACIWMSYGVNKVGTLIKDFDQNSLDHKNKMRIINKYMKTRSIPFALQYKIREFLSFYWKKQADSDMGQEEIILNQLPKELKEQLEKKINGQMIDKCPLFSYDFTTQFKNSLSSVIKRVIIHPENRFDISLEKAETHLCFLEQGEVMQVSLNKFTNLVHTQSVLYPGSFLSIEQFVTSSPDDKSYKSVDLSSLLTIAKVPTFQNQSQSDFLSILQKHPKDYQIYCQLRDNLLFHNKTFDITESCPVCKNRSHKLNRCPFVTYVPDSEFIIKRHQYSESNSRIPKIRKSKRERDEYHALAVKDVISDFANYFQSENKVYISQLAVNQIHPEVEETQDDTSQKKLLELKENIDDSLEIRPRAPTPSMPIILEYQDEDQINWSIEQNMIKQSDQGYLTKDSERHITMDHVFPSRPIQQSSKYVDVLIPPSQQTMSRKSQSFSKRPNKYLSQSQAIVMQRGKSISPPASSPIIKERTRESKAKDIQQGVKNSLIALSKEIQGNAFIISANDRHEVEKLRLSYNNTKFSSVPDFDCQKNFEGYMTDYNIEIQIPARQGLIVERANKNFLKSFSRLLQYMNYPATFLQKYRQVRRTSISLKRGSIKPGVVKKILRMTQLKHNLQKKKIITGEQKLKRSQICPLESEFCSSRQIS